MVAIGYCLRITGRPLMATDRISTIWIPTTLCLAGVVLGLALARFSATLPPWGTPVGIVVAAVLIAGAVFLAFGPTAEQRSRGGRGGRATASGTDAKASGGRGGDAGAGDGGTGGDAVAKGSRSVARGGDGGRG
jgi:hypothetical protein